MAQDTLPTYIRRFNSANTRALLGGGALMTWLATGKDTGGEFSLFEAKGFPGMEPPPHMHRNEDETYYLLEGEMFFRVGEEEFIGKPGDFVFLPRNVRHEFKVLSDSFRCLCGIYPAGFEGYFEALSTPHGSEEVPPRSPEPPPAEALEMMKRLDAQFGITYFTD